MVYVESHCNLMAPLRAGSLLAAYCASVGVTARAAGGREYVSIKSHLFSNLITSFPRHLNPLPPCAFIRCTPFRVLEYGFLPGSCWIFGWQSKRKIWRSEQGSVAYRGGVGVFNPPPPEIPKALHNRAKLNPIVKTVKNC